MKPLKTCLATVLAATLVACASSGSVGGLETTSLVRYECEGKSFSARITEDNSSVRLRTHEGSINLDRSDADEFKGDGWVLKTQGGLQLFHKDKVVASNCKKAV
jgi:hypothetical protein